MATALVDQDAYTAFTYALLIPEGLRWPSARHLAHIVSFSLVLWRLIKQVFSLLKHLLLNDILVKYLVIELQWFLINQLIVEAFAIGRLYNVALRVNAVLIALLGWLLVFALKLFLLFNCMKMMLDETFGRRNIELGDTTVVKFINRFVESVWIDSITLSL